MRLLRLLLVLSGTSFLLPDAGATAFSPVLSAPFGEPDLFVSLDAAFGIGSGAGPGPGAYVRVPDNADIWWLLGPTSTFEVISSYAYAEIAFGICVLCDGSDDLLFSPSIPSNTNSSLMLPLTPERAIDEALYRFFIDSNVNEPTLASSVGKVFSDPLLNPLFLDHMVSFELTGAPRTYVVAFEDWFSTSPIVPSDLDYNDFVMVISETQPIPEPGTIALMLSGLLAVAGLARRRSRAA